MGATEVLASYESLLALTGRMKDAATHADWDGLIAIEKERAALVAALKPLDATTRLDDATRHRKQALISQALADDEEVRGAVTAWMEQFQSEMQSNARQLKVLKMYGA